ncbi:uncharacterized protein LOC106164326 [Lingula anatina]|uniref:Uncharacterized protein LOC106164326 n=1 Tax=Lingula anatina TaxID=7574 RepID=A0A1S3IHR1_LINAN|nr:uncharacterized protein LOC106164326 [Lingula anatina]|eukprot:XP_013397658.1 uncharacterized protein LOC106164326 [Lingula anatina]
MEKQIKIVLTCVITLLVIILSVNGDEYCCPYYTSYGSYRSSFYCSQYCCGTSTRKYCCDSFYDSYYPSYSYSWLCPTATSPTTASGEYCCAYYNSNGTYIRSFYCSDYCCGTSTDKYCCSSSYYRYYKSYSSLSTCSVTASSPSAPDMYVFQSMVFTV